MRIIAIALYKDLELKRLVQPGEFLEVTEERGAVLLGRGLALAIPEEKQAEPAYPDEPTAPEGPVEPEKPAEPVEQPAMPDEPAQLEGPAEPKKGKAAPGKAKKNG